MSTIPGNLGRVPNLLLSQLALANLARTQVDLFGVQSQLTTGRAINRPSDDPVRAATIGVLDDNIERSAQLKRNISHASAALNTLDQALGEMTDLARQARDIASDQSSTGSNPETRSSQGVIIEQMLNALVLMANRQGVAGYMFGGSNTDSPPVIEYRGGYRYKSDGAGITTDLGFAAGVPITINGQNIIGTTSGRVQGAVDLNPELAAATRLTDMGGARGLGVSRGTIEFSFDGGPRATIDLSKADSVADVTALITSAIQQYEIDQSVTILDTGGVSVAGGSLSIDVVSGSPDPELTFYDVGTGKTAEDLGLASSTSAMAFSATSASGMDLNPKLTLQTRISDMSGIAGPLGSIRINNLGGSAVVDLSAAVTLEDVKNAIESTGLGVRMRINAAGTGIDVFSDTATGQRDASTGADLTMSIEEVSGENFTATRLGIRSLSDTTLLSEFNEGRGVEIVNGKTNPLTGLVDPTLNTDFKIVLGDATPGTEIAIDLRPQDIVSVNTLLTRLNDEIAAAGHSANLVAELSDGSNGIVLRQNSTYTIPLRVEQLNDSPAAKQLGLLDGTYDSATTSLVSQDRATVRVQNLFTNLLDLRNSLKAGDVSGITLAGEGINRVLARLNETQGLVGGYAQRVEFAEKLEEDRFVLDTSIRSSVRDVDFTEAALRLSTLQTQLTAGLQTAALSSQRTLLDFLQ